MPLRFALRKRSVKKTQKNKIAIGNAEDILSSAFFALIFADC